MKSHISILDRAKAFCRIAHSNQLRSYGDEIPYYTHPFQVAGLVSKYTDDHEIIAGAYLHDVIEDTAATEDDVILFFGERVGSIVVQGSSVTKHSKEIRAIRKALDLVHYARGDTDSKLVKSCDMMHNLSDFNVLVDADYWYASMYFDEKYAVFKAFEPLKHSKYKDAYQDLAAIIDQCSVMLEAAKIIEMH